MRYALSGKNGKACKRTRVIPYVWIRHAICRAAANGCEWLRMRQTESLQVAKCTKSDGGSWELHEYDVRVGYFLSLRQLCQQGNSDGKNRTAPLQSKLFLLCSSFTTINEQLLYVILKYPIYISSIESNVPQVEQEPSVCDQQMNDDGDLFSYCGFLIA